MSVDTKPLQLAALKACVTNPGGADIILGALNEDHFPDFVPLFQAAKEMHSLGFHMDAQEFAAYSEAEKGIEADVIAQVWEASIVDPRVVVRAISTMRSRQEAETLGQYLIDPEAAKDGIAKVVEKVNKFSLKYARLNDEPYVPLSQFMLNVDQQGDRPVVILPGFGEIDQHYRIRPGTMNVIVAPPGVGKSSLALNMAVNAARQGHSSLFISLELPEFDLKARLTAIVSGVSAYRVREKSLSPQEAEHVKHMAREQAHVIKNVNVIAPYRLQVDSLQGSINKWIVSHGIKVVFIDYLQALQAGSRSEYERVTYISETIRQVAKVTGIAIVAISSGRRRSSEEVAKGGAMTMHDMRSSGSIEYDAHSVVVLSRSTDNKHIMKLDILKNRDGACFGTDLYYDFETQRIAEYVP